MSETLDKPKEIREGEELEAAAIEPFLKDSIPGLEGEVKVSQFPSGHSNLTYSISVGDADLVLRRPPFGTKAATAHDMHREYKVLKALREAYPYCPEVLAYTDDESVIGCPFYVMRRIKGIILRKELPKELNFTPEKTRAFCEELIDVHAALHNVDMYEVGLDTFGKPEGYTRRQVEGWSKRYRKAKTPDVPDCEAIMAWLAERMPPDPDKATILHGDFKPDNVILDPNNPTKIIGVLDWEMATIGNPLMDLGSSLGYWTQKGDPDEMRSAPMMPPELGEVMSRKEIIDRYAEKTGINMDNFNFYWCFGIFRLIVIAQQIYYRFYHKQTKDQRFAQLGLAVHILANAADRIVEGKLEI
ncbi:phosphotransferase family protein [Desulfatibacillum aliphaticivorans]|uniref:phosphotransferase family protein n=1 Tax=Desulfatibacillum aliphaticivorans TaxID=218208 RepID=UPI00041C872B|nr:phosphotransferase family protein [Desulfatibacillum aliphaticivorans]